MNKDEEKTKDKKKEETPKKKKHEECKHHEQLDKLKEESSLKDEKILRLSAEMQNMRRRFDEEKSRLRKYDGEEIIEKMITPSENQNMSNDRIIVKNRGK